MLRLHRFLARYMALALKVKPKVPIAIAESPSAGILSRDRVGTDVLTLKASVIGPW